MIFDSENYYKCEDQLIIDCQDIQRIYDFTYSRNFVKMEVSCESDRQMNKMQKILNQRQNITHSNILQQRRLYFQKESDGKWVFNVVYDDVTMTVKQFMKIKVKKQQYFSIAELQSIIKNLVEPLVLLQNNHQKIPDLNPQNIFVMQNNDNFDQTSWQNFMIGPSINSTILQMNIDKKQLSQSFQLMTAYLSPELSQCFLFMKTFLKQNYYKHSAYSLGLILLMIATLKDTKNLNSNDSINKIQQLLEQVRKRYQKQFQIYNFKLQYGYGVQNLIRNLLQFDISQRLDFIKLVEEQDYLDCILTKFDLQSQTITDKNQVNMIQEQLSELKLLNVQDCLECKMLYNLKNMKSLKIIGCSLEPNFFGELSSDKIQFKLQTFQLHNFNLSELTKHIQFSQFCKKMGQSLIDFSLICCRIDKKCLQLVSSLKYLIYLDISGNFQIQNDLDLIFGLNQLKQLSLGNDNFGCGLDDQFNIKSSWDLEELTVLNLSNNDILIDGLKFHSNFKNLKEIIIDKCNCIDLEQIKIFNIQNVPQLKQKQIKMIQEIFNQVMDDFNIQY